MKLTKQFLSIAALIMLGVVVSATFFLCCSDHDLPVIPTDDSDGIPEVVRNLSGSELWETAVDYGDAYNWALLPATADKPYDVFYLQPTSWTLGEGETVRVAGMDNREMRTVGYVWSTLSGQAVFSEHCNVYAPYYRQADAGYIAELSWDDVQKFWAYEASKDASQALDYYFEHYNHGRPFFLAGHSQGAAVAEALLAGYFREHPEYYSRMIAAYPIGYAITTDYLARNPHLKFAEGADDTGVIVSWKRDATPATLAENKGSLLVMDYEAFYAEIQEKGADAAIAAHMTEGLADATVDTARGVIVTHADPAYRHVATVVFGPASYHSFDWLFFTNNLKENVAARIGAYEYEKKGNN